jgi:hypothetical protein
MCNKNKDISLSLPLMSIIIIISEEREKTMCDFEI